MLRVGAQLMAPAASQTENACQGIRLAPASHEGPGSQAGDPASKECRFGSVPEKEWLAGVEDTSSLAGERAGALQQPASTFASGDR